MSSTNQRNGGLVGRGAELDRLQASIDALQAGRGGCLFIAGEPGIGKSTLVKALADQAGERSIAVFWGFCWEAGGGPAYWPWTQLLRDLVASQQLEPTPDLAQILPEWAATDALTLTLQPDQAQFQLMESVRSLLGAAGARSPLVLVLEDLHAADSDSLSLLEYLVKHARHLPLLIVATFREMEARAATQMAPLWRAVREAELLRPARLNAQDITDYLTRISGHSPEPARVDRLLGVTEGNPLFLTEIVDIMAEDEALGSRLPDTIGQVIGHQLNRLPHSARALLERAAVIGREFDIEQLSSMADDDADTLTADLAAAVTLGLLESLPEGCYRFFHVLCCDALLQSMDTRAAERLHQRYAASLQAQIDAGNPDRYPELATQLSRAGNDSRPAAVRAWRAAARRARERLAFEEAAHHLDRALAAFGDGPRFPPTERCELILELAAANLTKGDIDRGHELCREAYAYARTVRNPQLMAEAALTYGSVIVIAKVDPDLVGALEETLALLPESDFATRARVSARLAGALQPAPDPQVPMQMARNAIELARTTGDDAVVYEVLRSAASALMDFASAAERVPLNREVGILAERFGDAAAQFRTQLRLVIDAVELGDRRMFDAHIRQCEQISRRIRLPHYQWRVASIQALAATIEGRYEPAVALLDEAARLAEQVNDTTALMTIPIQKLLILQDWAAPEAPDLTQVSAELETALTVFPDAELYVRPLFASYLDDAGRRAVLGDQALVERIISGGDRFTIVRLSELAVQTDDQPVLRRCYDALLPYQNQCASLGLMGSGWHGPVDNALGVIASAVGDLDAARAHLDQALAVCERMNARPFSARVWQNRAILAGRRNEAATQAEAERRSAELIEMLGLKTSPGFAAESDAPTPPTPPSSPLPAPLTMTREGDLWHIQFGAERATFKASRGLEILSRLVARPGEELHVLDLVTQRADGAIDQGDAGPVLDEQARQQYQHRIEELREELQDAETLGDAARADHAREEIEFITRELSRAYGLQGRARPVGRAAERARVNVQRRLRDAVRRIEAQMPPAGVHLQQSLKTGSYCRYQPP
jgi:tetratricopeptide (TPR) repeat protein